MDFRKIKSGMRVRFKSRYYDKQGTIRFVYFQDGYKFFDILFDGEDVLNCAWSRQDRDSLTFAVEEFKMDFDEMIKKRRK